MSASILKAAERLAATCAEMDECLRRTANILEGRPRLCAWPECCTPACRLEECGWPSDPIDTYVEEPKL